MKQLTASLTRTAYLFPLVACMLLLFSCTGGAENGEHAQGDTAAHAAPTPLAAASDCKDLEHRVPVYDSSQMIPLRKAFVDHFKVEVSGKLEDIKDPVLRIPWKSIEAAQKTVATSGKPVRGIYISYGLDGDKFHPIFEFMHPDSTNGDLQIFAVKTFFSFDGTKLKKETDPKNYTDAYFKDIRVERIGSGFSALKNTGDKPDPLGTWYQYPDKLNNLLAQNPVNDTVLVLSCISQNLCYDAFMIAPPTPEFRHLLTLHVADGAIDQLVNGPPVDMTKPYVDHAMDLGGVCPPHCPKGKP
ncbi:MAG: hypothetical protein ABIQ75_07835 [Flavobacteriales bacterium]